MLSSPHAGFSSEQAVTQQGNQSPLKQEHHVPRSTYCEFMIPHHVIKLFIYFFIFLLCVGGEHVWGVRFGTVAASVFFLVKCLADLKNQQKEYQMKVLTPYRLNITSLSSLIFLYLSSMSGLCSKESSGSGLSQSLCPFFLKVWNTIGKFTQNYKPAVLITVHWQIITSWHPHPPSPPNVPGCRITPLHPSMKVSSLKSNLWTCFCKRV